MNGILIIGHGSRSGEAKKSFEAIVKKFQSRGYQNVCGAHMEFGQPDIEAAAKTLIEGGAEEIRVLPMFLYSGIHIKEDIPAILDKVKEAYPHIPIKFGKPFEEDDLIVDLLEKRYLEMD